MKIIHQTRFSRKGLTVYRNLVDSAQAIVLAMRKIGVDSETPSNCVSLLISLFFLVSIWGAGCLRVRPRLTSVVPICLFQCPLIVASLLFYHFVHMGLPILPIFPSPAFPPFSSPCHIRTTSSSQKRVSPHSLALLPLTDELRSHNQLLHHYSFVFSQQEVICQLRSRFSYYHQRRRCWLYQ